MSIFLMGLIKLEVREFEINHPYTETFDICNYQNFTFQYTLDCLGSIE